MAINLVVVDILEGFEKIDGHAFMDCISLTTVSFPTTLTLIGWCTFDGCESLDNVDLFHTNLQELDDYAFSSCSELKSMTIPDSLQTLGSQVFCNCSKLVPSNIDIRNFLTMLRPESSPTSAQSNNNPKNVVQKKSFYTQKVCIHSLFSTIIVII